MSRVCKFKQTGCYIEYAHPGGYKHSGFVGFAQLRICDCKYFVNGLAGFGIAFYQGFCRHHKHCGGNSFAGDVGYEKSELAFADEIEIVKVAAHLLGGVHCCVYIKFAVSGIRRENHRYCGMLNGFGKVQFFINPRSRLRNIALERQYG